MARFVKAVLAERVVLDASGVVEIHNPVRHLGPRVLPWTAELALIVILKGMSGESFILRAEVALVDDLNSELLFWRNSNVTITPTGITTAAITLGPMKFKEPGTYEFRVHIPGESTVTTAGLTRA